QKNRTIRRLKLQKNVHYQCATIVVAAVVAVAKEGTVVVVHSVADVIVIAIVVAVETVIAVEKCAAEACVVAKTAIVVEEPVQQIVLNKMIEPKLHIRNFGSFFEFIIHVMV